MTQSKTRRKQIRPSTSRGLRRVSDRPHHSANKRAAIMAALLEGQGVMNIARNLKVPPETVSNYKRKLTPAQIAEINAKRAGLLDDMLWTHLESNFRAMNAITQHVQSEKYIQKHDPDALAVLYGVINDKSVRVLDAYERARGAQHREESETAGDNPGT